jgi:hypothetical protein
MDELYGAIMAYLSVSRLVEMRAAVLYALYLFYVTQPEYPVKRPMRVTLGRSGMHAKGISCQLQRRIPNVSL